MKMPPSAFIVLPPILFAVALHGFRCALPGSLANFELHCLTLNCMPLCIRSKDSGPVYRILCQAIRLEAIATRLEDVAIMFATRAFASP